ncbi:MAG: cobA [Bacteroidetes bacterium]|nr:cobA [Bacteroidota bacterium]
MKQKEIYPKLTVVGAGPGDPELITIKAVHAISEADVVLYDSFVNRELLKHAPINALKIFIGKKKNKTGYSQEHINNLIIDLAFTYGRVVHLQGGDPFIADRGREELIYAEAFNIETAFVPGISNAIGVPGSSGIPLTHRNVSESFWVLTGSSETGELSEDIPYAAKTDATVVILKGISKLKEIVSVYQREKKGFVPIAVIQNGTLGSENAAIGNIDSILNEVEELNIQAPAVIVIGEVVKFHRYYSLLSHETDFRLN